MKNLLKIRIATLLIVSLALCQVSYANVTSKTSKRNKEKKEEWVTKGEVREYFNKFRKWIDYDAEYDLFIKVASRCEVHGYIKK